VSEPKLDRLFTTLGALRRAHVSNAGVLAETSTQLIKVAEALAALSVSLQARNANIDGRIAAQSGRIRALALRVEGCSFELAVGLEALARAVDEPGTPAELSAMEDTVPGVEPPAGPPTRVDLGEDWPP
jgi:hypothetical protein